MTSNLPAVPTEGAAFIPPADSKLAALAVLEQFAQGDYDTLDALLASMDDRELRIGLLDLASTLSSMVARAANTTEQSVVDHIRNALLGLINSGELSAG